MLYKDFYYMVFTRHSTGKICSSICIQDIALHYQVNPIRLTVSCRRPLSYRNQSIDLQSKSMDWFLYDRGIRHERVNLNPFPYPEADLELLQHPRWSAL